MQGVDGLLRDKTRCSPASRSIGLPTPQAVPIDDARARLTAGGLGAKRGFWLGSTNPGGGEWDANSAL